MRPRASALKVSPGKGKLRASKILLVVALASPGCATVQRWTGRGQEAEPVIVRPGAPADYDYLVGRQFELDGKLPEASEAYARAVEKDPDSAYLRRKVAELAARQGHYAEALEQAERAHALDPDDHGARLFLGTLYRLSKQPDKAEAVLRDPDGEPIDDDAALLLFSIYLDNDRLPDALAEANWLIKSDPSALRGYFALASVYERMERPADAELALRKALQQQPGSLAVYGALARGRHERDDREGEIAIYREVLAIHPHHHATLLALADAQIALNRNDDAIKTLNELEKHHPGDLRVTLRLGFLEYENKHYAQAEQRFSKALEEHPDQPEIAYYLGLVRRRTNDEAGAIAAFERVPQDHERYAEARTQLAGIYEKRGDPARALQEVELARKKEPSRSLDLYAASLRAKSGDFPGAVSFLEGLLATAPDDDELLYNLGVLYGENDHFDEALQYMNRALAKNPDNANALNYVGYTWAEKGQNLDEAEKYISRALALRPDDGFITDSLGWVYYMRARALKQEGNQRDGRAALERAIEKLERAEELTGGDPVISEHLGDAYLLENQKPRALEKYREAIHLDPRDNEQPDLRRKYDTLREELGAK